MSQDLHCSSIVENAFEHVAIDPKHQVRFLEFHPSTEAGLIRATFRIVTVKQLSQTLYRALSYTWGSASNNNGLQSIEVDGQTFQVRPNLYDFLLSAQQRGEQGLFFIDAICINQIDEIEKPRQIMHMDRVYRHANQVIAWLGGVDSRQHPNVDALHRSINQNRRTWDQPAWDGLHFISHVNYWSRMWVVQEVVLAESMEVWCGPFTFPLELFQASSSHMAVSNMGFAPDGSPNITLSASSRLQTPAQVIVTHRRRHVLRPGSRDQWNDTSIMTQEEILVDLKKPQNSVQVYQSRIPDPLWQVMRKFGRQQCWDPMDKLYGLLGILFEKTRSKIRTDYGRGVLFAFYQALRVGLEELWPRDDPVSVNLFQDLDCSYISYYSDVRTAFSLEDNVAMPILRGVCKELDFYQRGKDQLLAAQLSTVFGWDSLHVFHHREFKKAIMSIEEEDVRHDDSLLFRFHYWQSQKLEKLVRRAKSRSIGRQG